MAEALHKPPEDIGEPTPPAAPAAAIVREFIRQRGARFRVAPGDYFSDPAWDILLELTSARLEERVVTVDSACRMTNISESAALRWINAMVRDDMLRRVQESGGLGQARITTTDAAHARILEYLARAVEGLRPLICPMPGA